MVAAARAVRAARETKPRLPQRQLALGGRGAPASPPSNLKPPGPCQWAPGVTQAVARRALGGLARPRPALRGNGPHGRRGPGAPRQSRSDSEFADRNLNASFETTEAVGWLKPLAQVKSTVADWHERPQLHAEHRRGAGSVCILQLPMQVNPLGRCYG